MTKEELERRVRELTASIETFTNDADLLKKDLSEANRPKITQDQMTEIHDAVNDIVSNIDFTDCDNYDMDFEIDYNNQIAVSSMEFNNSHEIVDDLCSEIEGLFNVIQPEDEA